MTDTELLREADECIKLLDNFPNKPPLTITLSGGGPGGSRTYVDETMVCLERDVIRNIASLMRDLTIRLRSLVSALHGLTVE